MELSHLSSVAGWLILGAGAAGIFLGAVLKEAGKDAYLRLSKKMFGSDELPPTTPVPAQPLVDTSLRDIQFHQVTADEMAAEVEKAPPLAHIDVSKRFEGARIKWQGTMHQAELAHWRGEQYRVVLSVGETLVFAYVDAAKYPQLKSLHKGHPMSVSGMVASVTSYGIDIADPELEVLAKPASPQSTNE